MEVNRFLEAPHLHRSGQQAQLPDALEGAVADQSGEDEEPASKGSSSSSGAYGSVDNGGMIAIAAVGVM
jgi:hypothetical protein